MKIKIKFRQVVILFIYLQPSSHDICSDKVNCTDRGSNSLDFVMDCVQLVQMYLLQSKINESTN